MIFSKFVKLIPLFLRDPASIILFPVSIIFGELHALIKFYAGSTLHVVSCPFGFPISVEHKMLIAKSHQTAWGSREGADENDAYRMIQIKHATHESHLPSYRLPIEVSQPDKICCSLQKRDFHQPDRLTRTSTLISATA